MHRRNSAMRIAPEVAIGGAWVEYWPSQWATAVIWIMSGLKRSRVRIAAPSSAAGRDARQQHYGETEGRDPSRMAVVVSATSPDQRLRCSEIGRCKTLGEPIID